MPVERVAAWALIVLLVWLWALYNRRIASERRQLMARNRLRPQDKHAPL